MATEAQSVKFLAKTVALAADGKGGHVEFKLANGKVLKADLAELAKQPMVLTQLALHGLSQKVGDSSAGFSKDKDYSGAMEAMERVWGNLKEGKFNGDREGTSREDLVQAVARLKKVDADAVRKTLDKTQKEKLDELVKHPAVKAAIAQIKAERLAAAVGDLKLDF